MKTLAFIIIVYLLVKFISRLFLPSRGKKNSNFRVFYRVFKNMREQQKRHQQQQQQQSANHSGSGNRRQKDSRFEEIEEAEFEEISDKNNEPTD